MTKVIKSIYGPECKNILWTRRYKAGYVLQKEELDSGVTLTVAYTLNGDYIGSKKEAYFLCVKCGIAPEKAEAKHNGCSIGYCKKERKWYGWSHRAIWGFKPGSRVKLGNCGFEPSSRKEFIEDYKKFWHDDRHIGERFVVTKNTICLKYSAYLKEDNTICKSNRVINVTKIPKKFSGRGAWTAKTNADAKQMAIDFAKNVS